MITYQTRYQALSPDDRSTVDVLLHDIFDTLESENGAMLAVVDKQGNGEAVSHGIGNQLLLAPLARSVGEIADCFDSSSGALPN